jgi:hypothetical protein
LSNDSTSHGYLTLVGDSPTYDEELEREISRWIRGVSGLPAALVFPRWTDPQPQIPKNCVTWCGFGITIVPQPVKRSGFGRPVRAMNVISQNDYIHEAIVLNADTGLIGMPQQTMGGGGNVRCLINPNIRINGLVQIDQASVYRAGLADTDVARSGGRINEVNQDGNLTLSGTLQNPASIAADGVYVVKAIDYHW